jgi:hypothetical protein
MVIGIFSGKLVEMRSDEIENIHKDEEKRMLASPFQMLDSGINILRRISVCSLDEFLKNMIVDKEQYPIGCLQDEKMFPNISIRLSKFNKIYEN